MKRITLVIALLAAAATTQGQEKKWSLDYEVGLSITRFLNYPALSVLEDVTPSYSAPTATFTLGMRRDDGFSFGLRYSNTSVNTAAVNLKECATLHDLSLVVRRSVMVRERVELYGSATLGFAILHNSLTHGGQNLGFNRYGISAGLEAGMRYYLSEETYMFFNVGVATINTFSKALDIPTALLPQTHNSIASAHLTGGFGIGIRPKVKKLNMPAEVIGRKEPLQLAYYPNE